MYTLATQGAKLLKLSKLFAKAATRFVEIFGTNIPNVFVNDVRVTSKQMSEIWDHFDSA